MTGGLGYWKSLNLMNTSGYTFKEVSYVFEWKLDGTICACTKNFQTIPTF